jgi:hypothetical protein
MVQCVASAGMTCRMASAVGWTPSPGTVGVKRQMPATTIVTGSAMRFTYFISDGGRAAAGYLERSDCAVRSLALSTGMPYVQAHRLCEDAGRRPRRSMRPEAVSAVYVRYASAPWVSFLDRPPTERPTVAQLAREVQQGRFIFKLRHHVFAAVNGTCMDVFAKFASRRRVEGYWTMEAAPQPRQAQLPLFAGGIVLDVAAA